LSGISIASASRLDAETRRFFVMCSLRPVVGARDGERRPGGGQARRAACPRQHPSPANGDTDD
jgi:hypothetical protein